MRAGSLWGSHEAAIPSGWAPFSGGWPWVRARLDPRLIASNPPGSHQPGAPATPATRPPPRRVQLSHPSGVRTGEPEGFTAISRAVAPCAPPGSLVPPIQRIPKGCQRVGKEIGVGKCLVRRRIGRGGPFIGIPPGSICFPWRYGPGGLGPENVSFRRRGEALVSSPQATRKAPAAPKASTRSN